MRTVLLALLLLPVSITTSAQATTGQSGTGDNIDIKYHRFEWNINPDNPIYISGSVTTYFVTTANAVNKITFDLNKNSYNNSSLLAYYHGAAATTSFPTTGNKNILTIQLPASLAKGVLDSVTIQYGGTPPAPSGGPGGCFQKTINGYPLFYTLSESYEDKDWWPCKADMQDKIDSMDIIITSPSKFTAAANGVLISETISGTGKISVFKHRYPIASYQIGIAVTQYDKYDRGTVNLNGTNVPITYYISKGRNPSAAQLAKFDLCKDEMIAFSDLFGDYPYKKEKYGMYEFGFSGGMEHPTFSGMSWGAFTTPYIVAHELMHQWFGDKVTMATWNHLWLSEGFASYGEVLAGEKVPASGINPVNFLANKKNSANSSSQRAYGCYIPQSYIVNSNTLWSSQYGNTVYTRGGMVVSMLRTLMGDDKFFQACRNYLNDPKLAYGAATTADLQAHLEALLDGFDLTGFFDSFVYGNGYPNYGNGAGNSIKWQDIGGGKIRFRVDAPSKSSGSNVSTYFSVIPLRVKGPGGEEKMVVLYDQGSIGVSIGGDGIAFGNSPTPEVDLGFTPVSVDFDPYNQSLAEGVTTKTTVVPVTATSFWLSTNEQGNLASLILSFDQNPVQVELEKSIDGVEFTLAGTMTAIGQNRFQYQDASTTSTVFYRAKITEATGLVTYSRIESVAGAPQKKFSLVTNPVHNMLDIRVPSDIGADPIRVSVFDFNGRKLLSVEKSPLNGILRIDPHSLTRGVYLIHIQSSTNTQTLRFVLSR